MDELKSTFVGDLSESQTRLTERDIRACRAIRRRLHGGIEVLRPIVALQEGECGPIIPDNTAPQEVNAPILELLTALANDPSKIDELTSSDWFTPEEARVFVPCFDVERWHQNKALLELPRDEQVVKGINIDEIINYYRPFMRCTSCLALSRIALRLDSQTH